MSWIDTLKFDEKGLLPAVVQDVDTNRVLMVAYVNKESLQMTLETKKATFFSRSRQKLWVKGEHSGHFMYIQSIYVDCDADTLIFKVKPAGAACHTGNFSCFYRKAEGDVLTEVKTEHAADPGIFSDVFKVIEDRRDNPKEGSYTNYLFDKGIDKILKKVGEETAEVIIGAKNASKDEIQYEVADLMYHLSVMLCERGLCWNDIYEELYKRYK
ncbi:MAG TPA: bifunctional phosphoribosyl-AMP cyclohydrolase/phosphoribosyl-ATP diphosphatase HisIE [Candidatus Aphodoplasma excrementigallinarum]|uniref:Histidine biosynthesis bifunctional protein HisIE n=1 Tax=Candidatus Aphodoplasma excrementigallinarum TaxID=2840673 RepID=A0A9D1NIF0_9FIRM|nr:bifunctional phosphoribosyl-AMP cyclohydrolase/phosphoribosyl-ATP diphosphatase HisIE [Candidatus Aphodoplasma excrementigallinarum]